MELEHQIIDNNGEYLNFRDDIMQRIRSAQYDAMRAVNKEMISLYWDIGRQITDRQKELGWGKSVVENLSNTEGIPWHPRFRSLKSARHGSFLL